MSTVSTKKINDRKMLLMVDQDYNQAEIAKFFGVSRQAVNKRLKELRGRTTKCVVVKKVEEVVDRKIDAMEQLSQINLHANEILDLVMRWIRGDEGAIQVLENKVRKVNVGTKKEPEWVKEFKFKDPHEIALKAMSEIRGQLKLQLEIFQALYDLKAVQEFQEEVLAAIGKAAPDVRTKILNNLNKRRALRSAVKFC
jgi:predicted transcriptional regulator